MRFLFRKNLRIFLLALLVILLFSSPALAQDGTAQVGIFEPVEVAPGEVVQVPVSVRDVKDLYGLDITIQYDPAVVQIVDADPSSGGIQAALGGFLDPGLLLFNTADNTAGTYHFVMAQYNPSEPKSGEGIVLVITFKGIKEGVSPLSVTALKLASREGVEIPSSGADSTLTVRAGVPTQAATIPVVESTALIVVKVFTPTPTATPVPTLKPTLVIEATTVSAQETNTAGNSLSGSPEESADPGFWLVNNWWIILILLGVVIVTGLYLFVLKKKSQ